MFGCHSLPQVPRRIDAAWLAFAAGALVAFTIGFTFTFGHWSHALKESYGYSQMQLLQLGFSKEMGHAFVMDAGYVTEHCGAYVTVAAAMLGLAISTGSIYGAMQSEIPYTAMICLFVLFGHSMGYAENAAISSNMVMFPRHRGMVCGLMMALAGLASGVMASIFSSVYNPDELAEYPKLLALAAMLIGIVATPIVYAVKEPVKETAGVVTLKFSILAAALVVVSTAYAVISYMKVYSIWTASIFFVFLCTLASLVYPMQPGADSRDIDVSITEGVRCEVSDAAKEWAGLSFTEMVRSGDFQILFLAFCATLGGGMMYADNASQIVKAFEHDESASMALVTTVYSVFTTYGRIITGFGYERLKTRCSSSFFLAALAVLMAFGFSCLRFGKLALAPSAGAVGFSIGGCFALLGVVTEETFGPKQLPLKYAAFSLTTGLGSLILSTLVAGSIYDAEAKRQHAIVCLGQECFTVAFNLNVGCCLAAALLFLVASHRYRRRQNYGKKLKPQNLVIEASSSSSNLLGI